MAELIDALFRSNTRGVNAERQPAYHYYRNYNNRCPAREPQGPICRPEGHFEVKARKWRGSDGSECLYDANGDLVQNSGESYNYSPDPYTWYHLIWDVFPHYYYGGDYTPFVYPVF